MSTITMTTITLVLMAGFAVLFIIFVSTAEYVEHKDSKAKAKADSKANYRDY